MGLAGGLKGLGDDMGLAGLAGGLKGLGEKRGHAGELGGGLLRSLGRRSFLCIIIRGINHQLMCIYICIDF